MVGRAAGMGGRPRLPRFSPSGRPRPGEGEPARHRLPGAGHRVPPFAAARWFAPSCAGPFRVPGKRSANAPDAGPQPDPPSLPKCEWFSDLEVGWACLLPFPFSPAEVLAASGWFATHVANGFLHLFHHQRLALVRNFRGVGVEHVVADGLKGRVANLGRPLVMSEDAGDGDPGSDGRTGLLTPTPRSSRMISTMVSASARGTPDFAMAIAISVSRSRCPRLIVIRRSSSAS